MKKIIEDCETVHLSEDNNLLINGTIKLPISEKEKRIINYFIDHPGTEIDKKKLIEHVWQERSKTIDDTNLTQLIYKVRRNLAAVNLTNCIKTVPGKGYKFIPTTSLYVEKPSTVNSSEKKAKKWQSNLCIALTIITFIIMIYLFFYLTIW